jgi:hypothetical protein
MHPTAPVSLVAAFALLTLVVAGGAVGVLLRAQPAWRTRALAVAAGWLGLTTAIALTGVIANFDARPPPFAGILVLTAGAGLAIGLSPVGRALAALPLWLLVMVQGFRLPLELVMHAAASAGVMPSVMSFDPGARGHNFDIVAGAFALVVGLLLQRGAPRALAIGWLVLATLTLANVLLVAVRATPLLHAYGDDQLNTWVAYWPFVWLPTVHVVLALAGQIVIARALRRPPTA